MRLIIKGTMRNVIFGLGVLLLIGCGGKEKRPDVQAIVDQAIAIAGGENYQSSVVSFTFRDKEYTAKNTAKGKLLSRSFLQDSLQIEDILEGSAFRRLVDGKEVVVADTTAVKYANAINSVHYFARLPYGLNDPAVVKRYLGAIEMGGKVYHKIEVTFRQEGGGDDFEDVYVYWFNQGTLKPDYLAYEFHVNGGGLRFRKALNERYVGGIRFVDYENYKPKTSKAGVYELDSLFQLGELELLSEIKLEDIRVTPDNYN